MWIGAYEPVFSVSFLRRGARRKGLLHFGCFRDTLYDTLYDWLGIESIAASQHVCRLVCLCLCCVPFSAYRKRCRGAIHCKNEKLAD